MQPTGRRSGQSLRPDEVRLDGLSPRAASCGVPFFFVPLRDEGTLARARPDLSVRERSFPSWRAPHLYPFVEPAGRKTADIRSRMFAPAMGIAEDPATGAAAAALAGYLASSRAAWEQVAAQVVDRGIEMGRPSCLHVECDCDGERVVAVRGVGSAVMVAEGTLGVPSI